MELENKSSGVAKAGLTTGIIGTALSVLDGMSGLANARNSTQVCACNEDHLVNRYEIAQEQKIAELETQIALKDAEANSSRKVQDLYNYVDQRFNTVEKQLNAQAVQNQATADSFQMVSERMTGLSNTFSSQLAAETHERKCADNTIVTYANATFYPKMVADVTTGSTTTAQTLYNPLPVETCNCNN